MKPESTRISVPEGFIEEMRLVSGIDADALADALDGEPTVGVRLNSRKNAAPLFEDTERVKWCATGRYLDSRPSFTLMPELHAGAFYVQDPSSMIHREIVARIAKSPCLLVDFCAAPGGKTTAAIDALPDGSVVIANEFEPSRVGALKENLVKWGYPCVAVVNAPTSDFRALEGMVDIALVDAPCSGEGMMRKDDDARSQWSKGLVESCAALQREIVADAAATLRPGGYLVYSTCTFNRTEDEDMLDYMADELGLESVDLGLDSDWGIPDGVSKRPSKRFMPHITRGEGLFVAVMRKPENEVPRGRRKNKKKRVIRPKQVIVGGVMLQNKEDYQLLEKDGMVIGVPFALTDVLDRLPAKTRVVSAGVEIGEVKGKDFVPSQAIALCTDLRRDIYPEVELTKGEALSFLRKENVSLPKETPKGYVLATYRGLPLGWLKNLGNRSNNLYPKNWRIRM